MCSSPMKRPCAAVISTLRWAFCVHSPGRVSPSCSSCRVEVRDQLHLSMCRILPSSEIEMGAWICSDIDHGVNRAKRNVRQAESNAVSSTFREHMITQNVIIPPATDRHRTPSLPSSDCSCSRAAILYSRLRESDGRFASSLRSP